MQLGGEARNPSQDLPRAVILSILIGGSIYILVQVAFIGALEPRLLAQAHTWTNLVPGHQSPALAALNAAPFYTVAKLAGLAWLAVVLRIDAIISPIGQAHLHDLRVADQLRAEQEWLRAEGVRDRCAAHEGALFSIMIAAIVGLLFLLPFPSWSKLVGVVTSASVLMYAGAPLALGALRLQKPDLPRPYRIPAGRIMAPLAFVLATLIVYWAGWSTYTTLMVALLVGYALMALSALFKLNPNRPKVDWAAAISIFPYLIGMGVISSSARSAHPRGPGGIIGGVGMFKTVLVGGKNERAVRRAARVGRLEPGHLLHRDLPPPAPIASRPQRPRRLPATGGRVTPAKRDRMRSRHPAATSPRARCLTDAGYESSWL